MDDEVASHLGAIAKLKKKKVDKLQEKCDAKKRRTHGKY